MIDAPGEQSDAGHAKSARGEAAYKEHLQAIAAKNDRARAAGRAERREREEQAATQRRIDEMRTEADLARTLDARFR
ncbi:MAG TPA: hypothetical protein VF032_22190 [Thermoleophilaceae bacterium]